MSVQQDSDVTAIDVCLVRNQDASSEPPQEKSSTDDKTTWLATLARELEREIDPGKLSHIAGNTLATRVGAEYFGWAVRQSNHEPMDFWLFSVGQEFENIQPITLPDEPAKSASGHVVECGELRVVEHLASDDQLVDELLEEAGVASAILSPVVVQGKVIGTLGIYGLSPRQSDAQEMLLVETVTQMLSASIARAQAECALGLQTSVLMSMMDSPDLLVAVLNKDGKMQRINSALERQSGCDSLKIQDVDFADKLIKESDQAAVQEAIHSASSRDQAVSVEVDLETNSEPKCRVRWSFTSVRDLHGNVNQILASGTDISCQNELAAELHLSQSMVRQLEQEVKHARVQLAGSSAAGDTMSQSLTEPLVTELPEGVEEDRRQQERRKFPYYQKIAPIREGNLPGVSEFTEVRMKDISTHGFAFLVLRPPKIDRFVVALGPSQLYLFADVKHVTSCTIDGRRMFTVGCCYSGRAHYLTEDC